MERVFVWNEKASSPVGPFDRNTLSNLIEQGVVRGETLVAFDGEDEWSNAAAHPATASWLAPERAARSARQMSSIAQVSATAGKKPICHSAYDPDFDLDILELNPGKSRGQLRDFALLAGGLNLLAATGLALLPMNPISLTLLIVLFVSGNVSLAWIYGVVLR